MPVMVVGVDNVIGRRAVQLLRSRGGEIRVFVEAPDPAGPDIAGAPDPEEWRAMGCKVAHGFLTDEAHVETALEQVHTVLLLLGRPTDDPDEHLERAATVTSAAIGAGCRRVVVLSDLAVAEAADNPWLAALAEVEEMAQDAPMESVVLRAALTYGHDDPLTGALAATVPSTARDGQHWPLQAHDVAMAAVLADAERQLDTSLHVVVDLAGPDQMSTTALGEALAGVVAPTPEVTLPAHAVELLARRVDRPAGAVGVGGAAVADLAAAR